VTGHPYTEFKLQGGDWKTLDGGLALGGYDCVSYFAVPRGEPLMGSADHEVFTENVLQVGPGKYSSPRHRMQVTQEAGLSMRRRPGS